jgi:hypothetical protein
MIESSTIEALMMTLMITFGIIFVTFIHFALSLLKKFTTRLRAIDRPIYKDSNNTTPINTDKENSD